MANPDQFEMTPTLTVLANTLFISDASKTSGLYRLKLHERDPEAPLSPQYLSIREKDVKSGYFPILIRCLAMAIHEQCQDIVERADWILGIPKAGDPIADELGKLAKKPVLRMAKEIREEGRRITSQIYGDFEPGQTVFGVDDVLTEGDTKVEFDEGVRANKLVLLHIGVGIDREQNGVQLLRTSGINCSAALPISAFNTHLLNSSPQKMDQETFDRISGYRRLSQQANVDK